MQVVGFFPRKCVYSSAYRKPRTAAQLPAVSANVNVTITQNAGTVSVHSVCSSP